MATRTVTGTLKHPVTGNAWASASVVFRLPSLFVQSAATIPPEQTTVTTDSNGAFSTALAVPDSGTAVYEVTTPDGKKHWFNLASGSAVTLETLLSAASSVSDPDDLQLIVDTHAASADPHSGYRKETDFPFAPVFNVMDPAYGAVGDGNGDDATPTGTDNSTAINAAIAAAYAAGGGTVYFPPGTYRCTSTITWSAGVNAMGEGPSASWVWGKNLVCGSQTIADLKLGAADVATTHTVDCTGVHFHNVQFRGGGGADNDRYVLALGGSGGSFLDGIFRDCKIERNLGTGAWSNVEISEFVGSASPAWIEALFDNCVFGITNGVATGANGDTCFNVEVGCMVYDSTAQAHNYDLVFQKCTFEASDGGNLSFSGLGHQDASLAVWPYNQYSKRAIIDGCLFKGAGKTAAGSYPYGILLEGPFQAYIGGGTKILTCRGAGLWLRSTANPYSIQASVIDGVEFDFTHNDEGIYTVGASAAAVYMQDPYGASISHCTMKVDAAGYTTGAFFYLYGSGTHAPRDIQIHGNACYDLSAPTAGGAGAMFLYVRKGQDVTVEGNKIYTRTNYGALVQALAGTKRLRMRNNEIHTLIGSQNSASVGATPLVETDSPDIDKETITAQFTALAVSETLLAAYTQPTTYAKTASATEYLATADYNDTELIFTASGSFAVGDILQDAAATTEQVKVLSVSGATARVERGYAFSALVTHAAGATWNLYAAEVAVTAQPTHPRNVTVTGGQAGQTAKVAMLGRNAYGGLVIASSVLSGTGTVAGSHAFAYIDTVIMPVRQNAGDTVALGTGLLVGIPGVFGLTADILEVARKASAATAYTIEATGTVSVNNQTLSLTSITAGDSFQVKAKVIS